jgi:hypothetical protein
MKIYSCETVNDSGLIEDLAKTYNTNLYNNLWYQEETKIFFSIDFTRTQMGKFNSIFTLSKDEFSKQNGGNPEYLFNIPIDLSNKSVLLIGGGPSTSLVQYYPDKYDIVISCNNFYMNEVIQKAHLNYVYLNPHQEYPNVELLEKYLQQHTPIIITSSILELYKKLSFTKNYEIVQTSLRFNPRIGIISLLLICIHAWNAKSADIIGMDGPSRLGHFSYHSFRKQQVYANGSVEHNYSSWSDSIACYERNYVMTFDYLLNELKTQCKLQNLAEGLDCNMLTGVSTVLFPLEG